MKGQGGRKLRWGREGRIEEMEGEETKRDQENPTKVMGKPDGDASALCVCARARSDVAAAAGPAQHASRPP